MFFNTFKSLNNFFRNISILALGLTFLYSAWNYTYFLDVNHVPELTNQSQIHDQYLRVTVSRIKILPDFFQTIISKDVTFVTLITTDKDISFISPLSENQIKNNKIEAGSTLIFGATNPNSDKIEEKAGEIQKIAAKYPEKKSSNILYLQGQNADGFTLFKPFGVTIGTIMMIYYIKYLMDERIKKENLKNVNKPTYITEGLPKIIEDDEETKIINPSKN